MVRSNASSSPNRRNRPLFQSSFAPSRADRSGTLSPATPPSPFTLNRPGASRSRPEINTRKQFEHISTGTASRRIQTKSQDGSLYDKRSTGSPSPAVATSTATRSPAHYYSDADPSLGSSKDKQRGSSKESLFGFIWKWQPNRSHPRTERTSREPGRAQSTDQLSAAPMASGLTTRLLRRGSEDSTSLGSCYEDQSRSQGKQSQRPKHGRFTQERGGFLQRSRQLLSKLGRGRHNDSGDVLGDIRSNRSSTEELLEQATHWLQVHLENSTRKAPKSPRAEERVTTRKTFLMPHRDATIMSHSSSVIHLLMGKPPHNTPMPDSMYGGAGRHDYFKVEISDPDGPTFLTSEARRLETPPLPSETSGRGRPRGYFLDYGQPERAPRAAQETLGEITDPVSSVKRVDTLTRWYGARMEEEVPEASSFQWHIPEHLPGSPFCPASQLHPSGGKHVCVYHGRAR